MPVEAIHISAFVDSLSASRAPAALRAGELLALGRLGCLVIDFPYFERFPLGVLRYVLNRPTAQSSWGEQLHFGNPVLAAESLLEQARSQGSSRLAALALGFVSHLAVDRSLHPLVNRMARERARRLGRDASREHTEVEKFHSVLFHEERLGFDFMGLPALRTHIEVDADAVHRDADLFAALDGAFLAATGKAPGRDTFAAWSRGYRQYVWLVSSPVGKRIVPAEMKQRVHGELYRGPWGAFTDAYGAAVARSRDALDAALGWLDAPASDVRQARDAFSKTLPPGPIDLG
ncbi:MAG TPA: zinc dependent phospholipase C family protein [Polyangiales bacterium]|nr:zinc dependent phospholipase C family protein [Polyangiales bacterium]